MNLILLFENDFISADSNRVRLSGRRYLHIKEILKAKVGEELCVGLLNDKIGKGRILDFNNGFIEIEVDLDNNPPKPLELTLILALPRPIMLKRILSSITELGVKEIYLVNTNRVEKSYWQSSIFKENEIKESLILGLEQAKDTILPNIYLRKRFKTFVEDELKEIIKGKVAIVAHPGNKEGVLNHIKEKVVLFIGPEGGFVSFEIEKLVEIGFKVVSLGERVLRVETAIPVFISKLK